LRRTHEFPRKRVSELLNLLSLGLRDLVDVFLQLITIVVLVFTCAAAFRSAKTAKELTKATAQQIEANKTQAAAAAAQSEIARKQFEESVRPILTFQWRHVDKYTNFPIVRNDGCGPANNCRWYYGQMATTSPDPLPMPYEVLGAGQEAVLPIEMDKARREGVTVAYESLAGTGYLTQTTWWDRSLQCRYQLNNSHRV
jgi:hypothetical protein